MEKKDSFSVEHETSSSEPRVAPGEVILGTFLGVNADGKALVSFIGALSESAVAMSTVSYNPSYKGRQVALLFAEGDLNKPIIMGFIHSPLMDILDNIEIVPVDAVADVSSGEKPSAMASSAVLSGDTNAVYIDGQRVVLEAQESIELKCGEASICLTKAGKILIRGKYLLNRSSGVNRIMGGSVQVN